MPLNEGIFFMKHLALLVQSICKSYFEVYGIVSSWLLISVFSNIHELFFFCFFFFVHLFRGVFQVMCCCVRHDIEWLEYFSRVLPV